MPEFSGNTVAIALGSNMGNRLAHLQQAINAIKLCGFQITALSSVWETAPWGDTDQPRFLNMCLTADTEMSGADALDGVKKIEKDLGRTVSRHWGPREIDIDIIIFGEEIIRTEKLTVPHPMMQDRAFVLCPLAEIAPDMKHPVLNKSVKELFEALPPENMVRIIKL